MSRTDERSAADDEPRRSPEQESWLSEQVRLLVLEEGAGL
jgi:hypothetical protein